MIMGCCFLMQLCYDDVMCGITFRLISIMSWCFKTCWNHAFFEFMSRPAPPRKKVSWMATVCCNLKHFCILFAKNWIVEISKTIYKCWLIFCSWVQGWGCNGNSSGITPPAEGPKQLYLPTHPNAITPSGPVPVASHHQHRLIKKQS